LTDHCRLLPSFFIIGPPRTGTSWLHQVLVKQTILPVSTKETRFFDLHFHRGVDWYLAHYPRSRDVRPAGEVAPTYFASDEARKRISQVVPKARVVCVFRNPVDRVQSHYRLRRAYGMIPWTFEQALANDPELLESSRYATHLRSWRQMLGAERVLATAYDDLRDRPQAYMDQLADFLEIPRFALTQQETRRVHASDAMTHPRNYYRTRSAAVLAEWFKARRLDSLVAAVKSSPVHKWFLGGGARFSELPPEVLLNLYEFFRPEVEDLESLLRRDLSAWKSPAGRSLATT